MTPQGLRIVAAVLALLAPPAFAQSSAVVVENAWVRLHDGDVTAYFHVFNNAEHTERLLSVATPVADRAVLLRTRVRSGRVTYQPVQSLEITGFDDERLRPGGLHVRLTGVDRRLVVGDLVSLRLRFERAGTIEVSARVTNQLLGNR